MSAKALTFLDMIDVCSKYNDLLISARLVPGSRPRRFKIVSVLKKQLRNDLFCSLFISLEVRSMQSNVLMYYISAEPLLLKAQVGFVRRHKSSAPF